VFRKNTSIAEKIKGIQPEECSGNIVCYPTGLFQNGKQKWIDYKKINTILIALKSSRKELEAIKILQQV
jgi:hypothetical protein